jgi:hypothetical protein
MRTRCVVIALLVGCSAPRPRTDTGEPVLTVDGRVVGGAARFGVPDLAELPRRSFLAAPPGGEPAEWDGIAVQRLLGDLLELDRGADTAVFHGARGVEAVVPIPALRQHRPVLADRVDGGPLTAARPDAAPLLLAWPTAESPGLEHDPRARAWWVEGVHRVEVVSWVETYGRALRVPAGAPDDARPGAAAFQTSCLDCHRVRGRGGTRGPDLTSRLATTAAREGLATALRTHADVPGARRVAELPAPTVGQLSAFLGSVAVAAASGTDDAAEPPPELPPLPPPPRAPGMGPTPPHSSATPAEDAAPERTSTAEQRPPWS